MQSEWLMQSVAIRGEGQHKKENNLLDVTQRILIITFVGIAVVGLLGAVDFIIDSVKIFRNAFRNWRARNRVR
jgi:hypothetical protein